jgi:ElaB/YqjD/DUF883 family membrane-anchored ribosome-binding protein
MDNTHTEHDIASLMEDARALMAATAESTEEHVTAARKRLSAAFDSGKKFVGQVKDKAVEGAKATDVAVHQHPYPAIGIAIGVGALVGFLLARQTAHRCH